VCVENVFPIGQKRQKHFPPKKLSQKKFLAEKNVTDFFSNSRIKKNFKILENIFLDFSFLKKQ
jgi:hypothetical protein